jgi:hypothetical protein
VLNPSEARGFWIVLSCLVLVETLVLVGVYKHRPAELTLPTTPLKLSAEGSVILPRDTVCVMESYDAVPVERAIESKDKEVAAWFVEHRRALYLKKSTRVRYYDFRVLPGMVAVVVRSGDDYGKTCFMPRDWLAP